jgi:hypothetical protein
MTNKTHYTLHTLPVWSLFHAPTPILSQSTLPSLSLDVSVPGSGPPPLPPILVLGGLLYAGMNRSGQSAGRCCPATTSAEGILCPTVRVLLPSLPMSQFLLGIGIVAFPLH